MNTKSFDIIMKSLIIKGDGNYILHGGAAHAIRYPPEEAIAPVGADGQPIVSRSGHHFDIPAFAHTGAHGENETGIPGVGHVFDGDWELGEHGEHYWRSDAGHHFLHGIDGLIRSLGINLKKQGRKENPKTLIQQAIDVANSNRAPSDQIPHVDSEEWRQLAMDYAQSQALIDQGMKGPVRGKGGKFISVFSNGPEHSKGHSQGRILEAYNIPMHGELAAVLDGIGYVSQNVGNRPHSWLTTQFMKPHNLSFAPAGIPENAHIVSNGEPLVRIGHGTSGGEMQGGVTLPEHHQRKHRKAGIDVGQKAFSNISSFGLPEHLSPVFGLDQHGSPSPVAVSSFLDSMAQALSPSGDDLSSNLIVDSQAAKDYIKQLPDELTIGLPLPDGSTQAPPLKQLLSTPRGWQQIADVMGTNLSFQQMWGENKPAKAVLDDDENKTGAFTGGSTVGKVNAFFGHRYGEKANEGQGVDKYLSHSSRIEPRHRWKTERGKGISTHLRAKDAYSHALLAAELGENHIEDMPTPEELVQAGIVKPGTKYGVIDTPEGRAAAANKLEISKILGNIQLIARGIEPMKIPEQGDLAALQAYTGMDVQGGTHEDRSLLGVPDHIVDVGLSEARESPTPPLIDNTGTRPKTEIGNAPVAPSLQEPAGAEAPPAWKPIDPMTPGLTENQQARARFGAAPMDAVREHLERTNQLRYLPQTDYAREGRVPPAVPEPTLLDPERDINFMTRYQQTAGDPWQTTLDDPRFAKSESNLVNVIETLQIDDAMRDDVLMKHVPTSRMDEGSILDIIKMSKRLGIAPMDVRTILNTKGDWERITKTYGYDDDVVKVVKISFGGI